MTSQHGGGPWRDRALDWWAVSKQAWEKSRADQVPLLAAGVAFYTFLAMFPAMIAAIFIYGLFRSPKEVEVQARQLSEALPEDAASVLTRQLEGIAATPSGSLGLGLLITLLLSLWSASGGVSNLMTAINVAYAVEETRPLVKRKLLAIGLTLGAIAFVVVAVSLVAVAPAVLNSLIDPGPLRWTMQVTRWLGLLVAMTVMLALLYRLAPDRENPRLAWVSLGAAAATVIWLAASLLFSFYVQNFGAYNKTYGALAGVVVLLLWLWVTMVVVLFGAEVNAAAEESTA